MRRSWKATMLVLLAVISVPAGSAVEQKQVVTGHTVYGSLDGLDPCLAGIVGVVRYRVMWFNDQVLLENTPQPGSSYIYAIEADAPDPRDQLLVPTGTQYPFTDPNGVEWTVTEYNFTETVDALAHGGDYGYVNGSVVLTPPNVQQGNQSLATFYTWVVQVGAIQEDRAATGKPYNFVDLADTCKFREQPDRGVHHATDGQGNWTSDWGNDTTQQEHLASDGNHTHEVYQLDLYAGEAPRLAPVAGAESNYLGTVRN